MKATLLKVLPVKQSVNGNYYQRIEFTMADGSWAKTDVCPNYRNYARWKPVLASEPGTYLRGLRLKDNGTVDADSFPGVISKKIYEETNN